MKRRTFLKRSLAVLALAGAGSSGLTLLGKSGYPARTLAGDFNKSLPIPPLLENLDKTQKSAVFEMSAQQGNVSFFPDKTTSTMGYNGSFLGPMIRVRNGQRFQIKVNNKLPQVTTLHWHGLHVPARWDGGPRQPIPAGTTWNPDFVIRQEAATL